MMLHHEKLETLQPIITWMEGRVVEHNFENTPLQLSLVYGSSIDVSCTISLYLAKRRFQRGRFLYTFQMCEISEFGSLFIYNLIWIEYIWFNLIWIFQSDWLIKSN
jgi:hypothetical protein